MVSSCTEPLDSWIVEGCCFHRRMTILFENWCQAPSCIEANDPKYFQPVFKYSILVIFWRCIGPNGVSQFVLCEGILTAKIYKYICCNITLSNPPKNAWWGWKTIYISARQCIPFIVSILPNVVGKVDAFMCFCGLPKAQTLKLLKMSGSM